MTGKPWQVELAGPDVSLEGQAPDAVLVVANIGVSIDVSQVWQKTCPSSDS